MELDRGRGNYFHCRSMNLHSHTGWKHMFEVLELFQRQIVKQLDEKEQKNFRYLEQVLLKLLLAVVGC
jgi:hypothetical protein